MLLEIFCDVLLGRVKFTRHKLNHLRYSWVRLHLSQMHKLYILVSLKTTGLFLLDIELENFLHIPLDLLSILVHLKSTHNCGENGAEVVDCLLHADSV